MTTRRSRALFSAALGLVVVLTVWLSGIRALGVESGSMGSAMPTGSLAITRAVPAAALTPGDVVSVEHPDGHRVTHRILDVSRPDRASDTVSLVLKGDANSVADPDPVVVTSADRLVTVVPHGGLVAAALTSGPALIVLSGTALILLLRRRWRVSGVVVTTGMTLALVATGATGAVFTDAAIAASGTMTSGVVNTPAVPTASQAATTGIVNIGFASTTVGTLGAVPSSYEVYRYAAASGGTGTLVCTTTTTFTCTQARTALATGTHHYAVRAKFATNWFSESARRSYSHDATAPTQTVTRPLAGSAGGLTQLQNGITGSCTAGGVACGTAADSGGGTVSSVHYTLRRNQVTTSGTTWSCWNGTSWVASGTSTCTFAVATGTTAWRVPGTVTTAYVAPPSGTTYSYVLVARATDSFGSQSSGTTVNFSA